MFDQREGDGKLPKVWAFQTGTNQWRRHKAWPPKNAHIKSLFLKEDEGLCWEQPENGGFDEYVSDPDKPVPFVGYITSNVPREYMVADQRFAAKRPDVLVYQSEILEEDIAVAGPVMPKLYVTTTGTDCDFVVKLIDVYPNKYPDIEPNPANIKMGGYQQLVRANPIRAKFRNSLTEPEAMVPGQITEISFSMPGISHVFRRGHRIMVQIQSSWFPLADRNPQTFINIPNDAKESDFQSATQRIYRSPEHSSQIELYVLED